MIDGVEVTVCVRVAIGSGSNRILSSSSKRTEICESQRGLQQLYITKFGNYEEKRRLAVGRNLACAEKEAMFTIGSLLVFTSEVE